MNALQQWWKTLVSRERIVVMVLAAIVIALLFQRIVLNSLYQGRDNARNSIAKQAELLQWVQQRSILVKQLQGASSPALAQDGQSISQRINALAKQGKLEINRFQTAGDNSVQVWLDNADFSMLLLWLETLQTKYAVHIENIAITETNNPGIVSVRATLTTG